MDKILYTTPLLMHPTVGGPYLRVENSIKALSKICEVHVISRVALSYIGGEKAEKFYKKITTFFGYSPSVWPKKNKLKYIINKVIYGKAYALITMDADYIINYAKKNNINIIWFGYGNISHNLMKKIKNKAPRFKIVCDTDSVWSRFVLRGLPFEKDEAKKEQIQFEGRKKEKEEVDWVDFCDVTTAVSEIDANYYRGIAKNPEKIKLFSNVLDLGTYKNKPSPPNDFKTPNIYLAGSFGPNSPMDVAARWVIDEILPLIRQAIPNIHFYIIGRNSDATLKDINDKNIKIVGQIESVLPYLCNVNVSIVPLKFESGTRFKILESAACGIPVVSTTLGAEGIPIKNGENILIADNAATFAQAIVKLIQCPDYGKNIAHNLKKYVEEHYSIDRHEQEALEIIKYLRQK